MCPWVIPSERREVPETGDVSPGEQSSYPSDAPRQPEEEEARDSDPEPRWTAGGGRCCFHQDELCGPVILLELLERATGAVVLAQACTQRQRGE